MQLRVLLCCYCSSPYFFFIPYQRNIMDVSDWDTIIPAFTSRICFFKYQKPQLFTTPIPGDPRCREKHREVMHLKHPLGVSTHAVRGFLRAGVIAVGLWSDPPFLGLVWWELMEVHMVHSPDLLGRLVSLPIYVGWFVYGKWMYNESIDGSYGFIVERLW